MLFLVPWTAGNGGEGRREEKGSCQSELLSDVSSESNGIFMFLLPLYVQAIQAILVSSSLEDREPTLRISSSSRRQKRKLQKE